MKLSILIATLLLTISAFAAGAFWAEKEAWPFAWLAKRPLLATYVNRALRPGPVIDSAVTQLSLTTTMVTQTKAGRHVGGGIHVHDNRILIVTGRGEFFLFQAQNDIRTVTRLDIGIDNGYAAFQEFTSRNHLPAKKAAQDFRFMDIEVVSGFSSRALLVTHHQWHEQEDCYTLRLSRLDLDLDSPIESLVARPDDWHKVFDTQPCLTMKTKGHPFAGSISGGRIIVDSPESVILSIGDHDFDGWNSEHIHAQDHSSDFGKIVRVNLKTGISTHVSIGHRNPQGLMLDKNGILWETEHGPRGGDELNIIEPGFNYGWPKVTYGTRYSGWDWPLAESQNRHEGYARPVFAWTPSIAVSNLIQVNGFLPTWDGDLLVASLGNKSLHRLRQIDSRIVFDEVIHTGYRIRDIDQFSDGAVVLWTDDGFIVELRPEISAVHGEEENRQRPPY